MYKIVSFRYESVIQKIFLTPPPITDPFLRPCPGLKIDGVEIPVVDQYKFSGVIFDKKLIFIPHINHLKAKCQKALQLMRVVAQTDWGALLKITGSIQIRLWLFYIWVSQKVLSSLP